MSELDFEIRDNVVCYKIPVGDILHYVFALVIPGRLPPSFNQLIAKSLSWKKHERNKLQFLLEKTCRPTPRTVDAKRSVRIDLFKRAQLDDRANLDGRSKCILDAMKQLAMIVDDNDTWLGWARVHQRKHDSDATVVLMSETMDRDLLKACDNIAPHALDLIVNGNVSIA